MRATAATIEEYLFRVADLLERLGIAMEGSEDLALLEDRDGGLSFEIEGRLPDGRGSSRSEIIVREGFDREGDEYIRARYEYELLDRERDFRRAFHLHSPDWFERHFLVVVHEHCERPVGSVRCRHYEGPPIRDAFAGIFGLLDCWTADPPDCTELRCLE